MGTARAPVGPPSFALVHEDQPLEARAKIFLVAGGYDSANFAQEIVDQRRLWRASGFADDEIACYWAPPSRRAFAADADQYRALADELRRCHLASPVVLRRHLATVAQRQAAAGDLPFVYLYVSSHGSRSVLEEARSSKRAKVRNAAASVTPCERALLDRHAMVLAGDRAGALHLPSILTALRSGAPTDDVVLTPHSLKHALAPLADVPKIVVLQGCFTGGFIGSRGDPRSGDGLATLPDLTLITAARHDRPSFGCQPGTDRTEFGRAYNQVLSATPHMADPRRIPWRRVYVRTRAQVEERETQLERGRSEPRFFRSRRHAKTSESTDEAALRCDGAVEH